MAFVTNPIVIALLVPFIFLLLGGMAKKLVRGSSWEPEDFYLGIEASLSALSFGVGYLFELSKASATPTIVVAGSAPRVDLVNKLVFTGFFLPITFALLFWVMSEHQQWQNRPSSKAKQWRLLGMCNVIGCGLIFVFILWVKGV